MDIIQALKKEMEAEALTTRKMLRLVPAEKFSWKPHEKSMTMQNLAVHIAELPTWVTMGLNTSELDFAKMNYTPTPVSNKEELLALFETSLDSGRKSLQAATEADLEPSWTMRSGEKILGVMTKY